MDYKNINCINYGPFDNNYLLLGLDNGELLGIDLYSLNVVLGCQLFSGPIKSICFDPANLVLISGESEVLGLTIV